MFFIDKWLTLTLISVPRSINYQLSLFQLLSPLPILQFKQICIASLTIQIWPRGHMNIVGVPSCSCHLKPVGAGLASLSYNSEQM